MNATAIIIIAIAATGVLMMRFRRRWLAKINIVLTNRITELFAGFIKTRCATNNDWLHEHFSILACCLARCEATSSSVAGRSMYQGPPYSQYFMGGVGGSDLPFLSHQKLSRNRSKPSLRSSSGLDSTSTPGGIKTTARHRVELRPAHAALAWRIKVSGLKGGHSGVDIHQGRGNALRILGGVLQILLERLPIEIADVNGGSAQNAIPREASALVLADASSESELKALLATAEAGYKADLGEFDSGLQITIQKGNRPGNVLDAPDAKQTAALLGSLHHGVLAMSPDVAGLVQTSTNLATVTTKGDVVEIVTSQRSAIESSMMSAARMVATVCRLAGFEVEHSGKYPGWKPEPNSEIVRKLQEVHKKLFGESAKLIAMHAGWSVASSARNILAWK